MAAKPRIRIGQSDGTDRDEPAFERLVVAAGDYLFEEGNPGTAAYLILSGEIEIRTGTHSSAPRTVTHLGKGEVVGEMSLLDSRPRTAAALAVTEVEAIRVSRFAFRARLDEMDPIMRSIMKTLVKRMRVVNREVGEMKRMDWRPK